MLSYKKILSGADQGSNSVKVSQPPAVPKAKQQPNGSMNPVGKATKSKNKNRNNGQNKAAENVVKFANQQSGKGTTKRSQNYTKMYRHFEQEGGHQVAGTGSVPATAHGYGYALQHQNGYNDQYQHSHYTSTTYPSHFQSQGQPQQPVGGGNSSNNMNSKKGKGKGKGNVAKDNFVLLLDDDDDEVCKVAAMDAYCLQRATYESMDPELENHLLYIYYCHGLVITEHARQTGVCQEISRKKAIDDWLKTRSPEEQERYLSSHKREESSPYNVSAAPAMTKSTTGGTGASPNRSGAVPHARSPTATAHLPEAVGRGAGIAPPPPPPPAPI